MSVPDEIIGTGWPLHFRLDTRGVPVVRGEEKIVESITIILNTPLGARPMRPTFGCRIHDLAFAPLSVATIADARQHVAEALAMWEPRIEVIGVEAAPGYEQLSGDTGEVACLYLKVSYRIRATHDERALVYPFYSIPEES